MVNDLIFFSEFFLSCSYITGLIKSVSSFIESLYFYSSRSYTYCKLPVKWRLSAVSVMTMRSSDWMTGSTHTGDARAALVIALVAAVNFKLSALI